MPPKQETRRLRWVRVSLHDRRDHNSNQAAGADHCMLQGVVRANNHVVAPPSFAQSQLDTLLVRRQQHRPVSGGGMKYTSRPSRFSNLNDDWDFAGEFSTLKSFK